MTAYLFIDGGFLERLIEKAAREYGVSRSSSELHFENIVGGYQKTFYYYYDALPIQKQNETEADFKAKLSAKQRLFDHINRTPYVHVREGLTRSRSPKKREQKGVDVLLAIDVFRHASLRNISRANIMATDLDYFPLFEALRDTPVSVHLHCFAD